MPSKRAAADTEKPNNETARQPVATAASAQPAPAKRQRVSRACDQCRAAREKCDGIQPQCFPCVSQSRPCTYEVSPKKRGVQTGYIRTLELALGWVFENVSGSEDALNATFAQQGAHGQPSLAGKSAHDADRLQKRWRRSRVHMGIEHILSGGAAPSPCRDRASSPSAAASDVEADALRGCANPAQTDGGIDMSAQDPNGQRDGPRHDSQPNPRNDGLPSLEGRQGQAQSSIQQSSLPPPGRLKLPPNHWRLLDIYFSYTHSCFPILEKQALFQVSYQYPDEGLIITPEDVSSGVHAELWSALALASLQDAASSKVAPSNDVDPAIPLPAQVYSIARGLLPPENGPFQVHHARALLLLSLVNLAQEKPTGAWLLTGSAIRILLDIHQPPRHAKERQSTELALMACFVVDTVLSVRYNRPPHLREEDLSELPGIPEDGLDQWEPWKPCDGFGPGHARPHLSRSPAFCISTFNHLYAITKVVARELWSRRRGQSHAERVTGFVSELQQAVDLNSPLGSFIASPECGNLPVPTAYVARATYLWAGALADPRSETFLSRLQDTVDQYKKQFGECGIPPFISTCLKSLASEAGPSSSRGQPRERLAAMAADNSSRWMASGPHPHPQSNLMEEPPVMARPTHLFTHSHPTTAYPTLAVSSLYNTASIPQRPQLTGAGGYGSLQTSEIAAASYSTPAPHGRSISSSSTHHHDHQHPHPHPLPPLLPQTGFGRSPDYDALLDDLASIECTDAVDVDRQFMTNLGFGPGCDIAEILTRDFGA